MRKKKVQRAEVYFVWISEKEKIKQVRNNKQREVKIK